MRARSIVTKTILIIGTIVSILFAMSCVKPETKELYLYNWTYYMPPEIIKRFEKEFHVDVTLDTYPSNEDMFAKLKASRGGYDIVVPSADYVSIMIKLNMLKPLNHEKLPNLSYIEPNMWKYAESYDPGFTYSVPYFVGAAGVAVNTAKVVDYPRSWTIFGETKLAGRMQLLDDMHEVLGIAQATLGFSVNTTDDWELEQVANLIINKWKPNIVKFDSEGFGKAFSRGEFWVSHAYPEVIFEEVPEERWDEIDFFLPEVGGPLYIDSLVILKDAPNADIAHEFINFFHRPEIYALFLDEFRYPSTVNGAANDFRTTDPFYEMDALRNYELKVDLGENLDKYNRIWQRIRYQ